MRTHRQAPFPITRRLVGCALLCVGALAGACSSGDGTANLSALQCTWPASLNDAGTGGCHAARAFVTCDGPSGGAACLSDGPITCEGVSGETCKDACAADQYGVACGSIGPSSTNVTPPAGCTTAGLTPAGIAFYCCPCGG